MPEWNLPLDEIEDLILAADVRFGGSNYLDDHIWALTTRGGEPPALSLQTTFGLRARRLRLFPRWVEAEKPAENPAEFAAPPLIRGAYANFAHLTCSPLEGIDADLTYWVPHAHGIAGVMRVSNPERKARTLRLEWAALLQPGSEGGHRMTVRQHETGTWYLHGQSGELHTVVLLRGEAQASPGPHPALAVTVNLKRGQSAEVVWAQAAASDPEDAYQQAAALLQRNPQADRTRIELLNAGLVDIRTGNPAWNRLFALGNQRACSLLSGAPPHLPHPAPVLSRHPDHGYSARRDGGDYPPAWLNGHLLWNAAYLASYLLTGYPELAAGIIENFLARQDPETGRIPNNPNQPDGSVAILATPMLASMAWQVYLHLRDESFLERVFDPLYRFLQAWLSEENDSDGDGLPEWQSLRQLNLLDHPIFAHWHPWSQGAALHTVESPSLLALLYRESISLLRMAHVLGRGNVQPALQAISDNLQSAVAASWDAEEEAYLNWDRDTHYSPPEEDLGIYRADGVYRLERDFAPPKRPVARLDFEGTPPSGVRLTLQGESADGSPLEMPLASTNWRWHPGRGDATSPRVFRRLEAIRIENLPAEARLTLATTALRRQTLDLLLPLTGGLSSPQRARTLIEETLLNAQKYWQPHGIPLAPWHQTPAHPLQMVSLQWNTWIGYGLLRYGYRQQSAELVTRLMDALARSLEKRGSLPQNHHCRTGEGEGERNTLESLPPIGLFLETLGVRIYSQWRVRLEGRNPFPWPVEIRFRGLHIRRGAARTEITFPDGQSTAVEDPAPCVVSAG